MANMTNPQELVDAEVFDPSGDKIGKVGEVYLRDDSRQPAWIMVTVGGEVHKERIDIEPDRDARNRRGQSKR